MPIDYKDYHSKWTLIRRLIMKRAENKCENCGRVHYMVDRTNEVDGSYEVHHYRYYQEPFPNYSDARECSEHLNECCGDGEGKWTVVVLTIAHMDRDKDNNKFSNLKALCQKCHLAHDLPQHIQNRKYGRNWKRNQYKLEF